MKFTKMHGLGNDHIVIDLFRESFPNPEQAAPKLCDRHLGIGADGLILVGPSKDYDFMMSVVNSDGSIAEMCGNGIRCLARYVVEAGLTEKPEFVTEALDGPHRQVVRILDNRFIDVTTSMGKAKLRRSEIPMTGNESDTAIGEQLVVDGRSWEVTCLNVGNPHCVVFVDDVDAVNLSEIGPKFETHPVFPKRVNTEFVQILDKNNIRMRVWERGCGETFACGTGSTASVVASILNGHTFDTVTVHLKYGDLLIEWRKHEELFMTGGANRVYTGEIGL